MSNLNCIQNLLHYFRTNDILSLKMSSNLKNGSIWYTDDKSPMYEFAANIFIRDNIRRLTLLCYVNGINTRLMYGVHDDLLLAGAIDTDNSQYKEIKIENASTLKDEGNFFQECTTNDYMDLEFDDIKFIVDLSKKMVNYGESLINANS